jgi:hypothetical protein
MRHMKRWAPLSGVALLLAACSRSTEIVNSWHDPDVQEVRFTKVLAMCMCRDPGIRRTVEDRLAERIKNAVPAYKVIPDAELTDVDKAKARVQQEGFDGAVVVRLVGVDKEHTYVPGAAYAVPAPYGTMWGGWGYGWATAYEPGYVTTDVVVNIDTNVYRLNDQKLVWNSRSRTYDPKSVPKLVDEVVDATVAKMRQENVLV